MKFLIVASLVVLNLSVAFGQSWPTFNLFTSSNAASGFLTTAANVNTSPFVASRKTFFVVHGFNSNGNTDWLLAIKDALLAKEPASQVFAVDWGSAAAGLDYVTAAANAKTTGEKLAVFIKDINLDPLNVHCIGHSLGAHACGFAGKKAQFARITGLDPAGPGFKGQQAAARLDKGDALLVDNIHGDQVLGIQQAVGHKDFYPNGGASQPGCFSIGKRELELLDIDPTRQDIVGLLSCSHGRIPLLFVESISSNCGFTSTKCGSYDQFKNNQCSCANNGCSPMGFNAASSTEEGSFYLATNSRSPYCQN
jgi:pancreatic triacylglycerol lipase